MSTKRNIQVYAHWQGMAEANCIGMLTAQQARGKTGFSFLYNPEWLTQKEQFLLDPDIEWFEGQQHPIGKENFGVILDSMPDTWGRTLMKRRAAQEAFENGNTKTNLYEIDFLLGVHDESRMGALRFKLNQDGPFLNNSKLSIPHWAKIKELQHAAHEIELNDDEEEVKQWLDILIAPGSSLGGARPKANILDEENHPWIAKFPSNTDNTDKAAWEYLVYQLALDAGINMSLSKIEKISGKFHTFFTKRFDRVNGERIHFASAMTMTGNNEDTIRDKAGSYLEIAEFIQFHGSNISADLEQLWRRIVFNIAISNTDDHLRNHGFIVHNNGWHLSPAYDINPSIYKNGLALNIDMDNNSIDFELAKSVGTFFQLNSQKMNSIIKEVQLAVSSWRKIANQIGIPRNEQEKMAKAFFV
ncbi:MAG TPA: HipA domain-containing protein [Sediminibacterium sp.]|uniref:type II toxin-antitoxin system HipA family toxin n=1 Tax=Sediminibacterium sp. TaxID=1917865 RepID=UPI0026D07FB9|nr:HipA domain-containing protein [Sediminibacterium sp.]HQS23184.1 HipA domain-containing protein [Sediminibacterium sp.]HQS35863.1 HipA domain-containing protein [Sediminibacterium sp.]